MVTIETYPYTCSINHSNEEFQLKGKSGAGATRQDSRSRHADLSMIMVPLSVAFMGWLLTSQGAESPNVLYAKGSTSNKKGMSWVLVLCQKSGQKLLPLSRYWGDENSPSGLCRGRLSESRRRTSSKVVTKAST